MCVYVCICVGARACPCASVVGGAGGGLSRPLNAALSTLGQRACLTCLGRGSWLGLFVLCMAPAFRAKRPTSPASPTNLPPSRCASKLHYSACRPVTAAALTYRLTRSLSAIIIDPIDPLRPRRQTPRHHSDLAHLVLVSSTVFLTPLPSPPPTALLLPPEINLADRTSTMDRTPSPSRRVRTPPAPLHGPKYDNYEPFSPRRSSRVAAQHNNTHLHPHLDRVTSPTRKRSVRDVTPTSSRPSTITRTAHFALSPPSSPNSPAKTRSPRSTRRTQRETIATDSDSDSFVPSSARRLFPALASNGMLPTPAKTPRKRTLHTANSLGRTARVLFEDRPATVEDAMPTPRKAHKTTNTALDLESLDEQMSTATPKIGVYVDSKERVPDREDEESNPFITRRGKGKAKAAPRKVRKMDEKSQKMFEAAARDEGMVYTQ